ncbi:unnamed protein product [Closterium sp. NIES-64]|nr:unnamed protein product [Closterium sp. NIES-64]
MPRPGLVPPTPGMPYHNPALPLSADEIIHRDGHTTLKSGLSSFSLAIIAGYHCERDVAETPSDQVEDVANTVIRDVEEWNDNSDEWWVEGRYDEEEVSRDLEGRGDGSGCVWRSGAQKQVVRGGVGETVEGKFSSRAEGKFPSRAEGNFSSRAEGGGMRGGGMGQAGRREGASREEGWGKQGGGMGQARRRDGASREEGWGKQGGGMGQAGRRDGASKEEGRGKQGGGMGQAGRRDGANKKEGWGKQGGGRRKA